MGESHRAYRRFTIKNYDAYARIVVAVSDSKGLCRPHSIGPDPEARHFYPKEAVTKTGPRERVTAILIDNDNNTYYRHAAYPPEKQPRPQGRSSFQPEL